MKSRYIAIAALICCTVISCYGIFSAPASDQEELERELKQNEWELESGANPATGTAAAVTPSGVPASDRPDAQSGSPKTITVIGDSVFLGATPSFRKLVKNAVIDAKISRQVYQAIDVAKKLNKKDKLGDTVIISLGTNGNFNPVTGEKLIDYLGPRRTIYWINTYGKKLDIQKQVNSAIRDLAKKHDNVRLISWSGEGGKHPDWFYQDGVHLNAKGQSGFSDFIYAQIKDSL